MDILLDESKKSDIIELVKAPVLKEKTRKARLLKDLPIDSKTYMKKNNTVDVRGNQRDLLLQMESINKALYNLSKNLKAAPVKTPANDINITDDVNAVDLPIIQSQAEMTDGTKVNTIQDIYRQLEEIHGMTSFRF